MSRVLVHSPTPVTMPTVMRLHRAGHDVDLPRHDATPELDDLVARSLARYVDAPDPWEYDWVLRGGDLTSDAAGRSTSPEALAPTAPNGADDASHDTPGEHDKRRFVSDRAGAGRVLLVGAGPGDPDLLTVAAHRAIAAADVLVCDRLAPLEALDAARADAEIIHVGKIPRGAFTPQEVINTLLVERATAGQVVVRLKGGDGFVFGRGGEEWQACVDAGVPVEVLPGVSSALAVPALAGIPVTHRSLTQGFTVVSGHVAPDDPRSDVDWSALARSRTTLVVLMGVATLEAITTALAEAGMTPTTPAAVIENGASRNQRVVRGVLATIAHLAREADVRAPAITVIGAVVDALASGDA